MDKRGQGLSTNAIILIVLGVIILVVLILGFTMGWDKIAPWISKENVDDVSKGCQVACSTQAKYAFCSQPRTLKDAEGNEFRGVTCDYLSKEQPQYGIDTCDIECEVIDYTATDLVSACALGKAKGDKVYYTEVNGKITTLKTDTCP